MRPDRIIPGRTAALAALAAAIAACPPAAAGGLEVPDLGTSTLGRGTAFAARADDLNAFHYNPAGLSKGDGVDVLLGASVFNLNVDFRRRGSGGCWIDRVGGEFVPGCEENPYAVSGDHPGSILIADPALDHGADPAGVGFARVSSSKRFGAAPMLVVNWGNVGGVEGLALAVGLITPSSFGTPSYPKTGAQRYALVDANLLLVFPGVGLAYSPNRYFRIGGVFLSGVGRFEQSQAIRPFPQPLDVYFNEDLAGDALLSIEASDPFVPTGIVGVMSRPLDWLEIGATVKAPAYVTAKGDVSYTPSEVDLPDSALRRNGVTLREHFPWVVRAGARYVHPRFDVEADFVWEQWSSLGGFGVDMDTVMYDGTSSDMEMPDAEVPKRFRDTYSVRLGGDVEVVPRHLSLRAGGYYQSSAYPESYETFSVDFPFGEQIGVGGGATWHVWIRGRNHLDVHAGYLHVFQPDVVVKRGVVQQQGLPFDAGDELIAIANVVNGGRYEVSMNIFGLALEGHFPLEAGGRRKTP